MDLIKELYNITLEIFYYIIYTAILLAMLPIWIVIIVLVFIPIYLITALQNEIKSNNNRNH